MFLYPPGTTFDRPLQSRGIGVADTSISLVVDIRVRSKDKLRRATEPLSR